VKRGESTGASLQGNKIMIVFAIEGEEGGAGLAGDVAAHATRHYWVTCIGKNQSITTKYKKQTT